MLVSVDMRPGHCYRENHRDRCDHSLASNLTRRQCCCSIGEGWNAVEDEQQQQGPGRTTGCEPCPHTGTGMYVSSQLQLKSINPSYALSKYQTG